MRRGRTSRRRRLRKKQPVPCSFECSVLMTLQCIAWDRVLVRACLRECARACVRERREKGEEKEEMGITVNAD